MSDPMARLTQFMDLTQRRMTLMLSAMPGRATAETTAQARAILAELDAIAAAVQPGDPLTPRMIEESVADVTEWLARAHDVLDELGPALEHYTRALELYRGLGDSAAVTRLESRVADVKLLVGHDVNAELKRLMEALEDVEAGSQHEAAVLIALGELTLKSYDAHGALKWLKRAEAILGAEPISADEVVRRLIETVVALQESTAQPGTTGVERAIERLALYRRLWLALMGAHAPTDPEESKRYERLSEALDLERASGQVLAELAKVIPRRA